MTSSAVVRPTVPSGRPVLVGLVSDTHGVLCQEVLDGFMGVDLILHAGDVGHHGGHEAVLAALRSVAPVVAVRGNVDDVEAEKMVAASDGGMAREAVEPRMGTRKATAKVETERTAGSDMGASAQARRCGSEPGDAVLLDHRVVELVGWRILVNHIVGRPPDAVDSAAAALIRQHQPHIVVFGHSHKSIAVQHAGVYFYNPGSAGPTRFKLPRTAALMELPPRCCSGATTAPDAGPKFTLIQLSSRAPPRFSSAKRQSTGAVLPIMPTAAVGAAAAPAIEDLPRYVTAGTRRHRSAGSAVQGAGAGQEAAALARTNDAMVTDAPPNEAHMSDEVVREAARSTASGDADQELEQDGAAAGIDPESKPHDETASGSGASQLRPKKKGRRGL